MTYFAHTNDQDQSHWQSIKDHLLNTGQLALELGGDPRIANFAYIAALLHDIGKYSQAFQSKLNGAKIKVDHSTAGAYEVRNLFNRNITEQSMATILAYCIAGHHGGLPDFGSVIDVETEGTLQARLKKNIEPYTDYSLDIDTSTLILPDHLPIKPNRKNPGFSLAFFTRMVYSILVDADFQETETFINNGKKPRGGYEEIGVLCGKFDQFIMKFDNPQNPIDIQRTKTLKNCITRASDMPGFFSLTVPTGGGKTFSSLAFALHHASLHDLKRVIYVIPYTSIIEQNAAEFKKCLGEENVLEHHSNFDWNRSEERSEVEYYDDQTNSAINKLKLAAENWDIPIVVTTNVQFFESLYANRSSRCRKLHNMAKSVIIFDEAQMLPREYMVPCLYAVHELVTNYGTSAVFCTATQPSLEKFLPKGDQLQELTPDPKALYMFFKRVQVKNLGKVTDAELIQRIDEHPQSLCIVNTRKHAKGLFEGVKAKGRFHLSTLMCPAHRKETITKIKERLKQGLDCRVISTQIMEAGIDVDFPVGYRAISGLDSIIQAGGRVNREGRQTTGDLYVFEPDSAFVKRTPAYIQQGADVARKTLRDYPDDPISLDAIRDYFDFLYGFHDESAFDSKSIIDCFDKGGLNFDFESAARRFRLIEDISMSVIIQYDKTAISILEEARASKFPKQYARKLQMYTVNIYEHEFQALQSKGLIDLYNDTYAVLNDNNYYNAETGLVIPESAGGEAIFFDG
jgi:CRISPR-associated endonuclease/helicase Cas3